MQLDVLDLNDSDIFQLTQVETMVCSLLTKFLRAIFYHSILKDSPPEVPRYSSLLAGKIIGVTAMLVEETRDFFAVSCPL